MPWIFRRTNTFKRSYKALSSDVQKRVDEALGEIAISDDPKKLGHRLHGKWEGYYSYEIGLYYRMIFSVNFEAGIIELIAVGTHKIYG